MNPMAFEPLSYKIHDHIAILSESEKSDWTLEVNLLTWGDKKGKKDLDDIDNAKIDIRSWNRSLDEPRIGKGVSLTREEAINLCDALIEQGLYTKKKKK